MFARLVVTRQTIAQRTFSLTTLRHLHSRRMNTSSSSSVASSSSTSSSSSSSSSDSAPALSHPTFPFPIKPPRALLMPFNTAPSSTSSPSSSSSSTPSTIEFHHLADKPELIPEVTTAIWTEWRDWYYGQPTLEIAIEYIKKDMCNKDALNSTFVATVDGEFAATAALATDDLPAGHPYYGTTPWLVCVWTQPKYRGSGIAMKLMQRVIDRTREMGYQHIWLMTHNLQEVYSRKFGFREIEKVHYLGHNHSIMRLDFYDTHKWKEVKHQEDQKQEKKEKQ